MGGIRNHTSSVSWLSDVILIRPEPFETLRNLSAFAEREMQVVFHKCQFSY